jgi:hypothetical protein
LLSTCLLSQRRIRHRAGLAERNPCVI